jgi:hypothetical protein
LVDRLRGQFQEVSAQDRLSSYKKAIPKRLNRGKSLVDENGFGWFKPKLKLKPL